MFFARKKRRVPYGLIFTIESVVINESDSSESPFDSEQPLWCPPISEILCAQQKASLASVAEFLDIIHEELKPTQASVQR